MPEFLVLGILQPEDSILIPESLSRHLHILVAKAARARGPPSFLSGLQCEATPLLEGEDSFLHLEKALSQLGPDPVTSHFVT